MVSLFDTSCTIKKSFAGVTALSEEQRLQNSASSGDRAFFTYYFVADEGLN
jgi:hypothetical protein